MRRDFSPAGLLVLACRLILGGVFIYASLDKLQHPGAFAQAIHNYHMLPPALLHLAAHFLPVLEILTGVLLVLGIWRRGAAALVAAMLLVFIVAIAIALAQGLDISCGCFHTDGGHGVGLSLLFRDLLLLALCLPPLLARQAGWRPFSGRAR